MSQMPLLLAIHLVGLAACLAIGPRHRPALCCALAFPVGLAVVVTAALLMLIVGLPYRPATVGAAIGLLLVGCGIGAVWRGIPPRTRWIAVGWTLTFAGATLALTTVNVALMSFDSHELVKLGRVIADDGGFTPALVARLDAWGVFQVVAQSLVMLTRQDFLYTLPVVFGVSFIPVFVLTLWHGAGALGAPLRHRAALVGLVSGALFTLHMVDYHLLYLHTNGSSAVYLFGFVVLFWLAEVERDPSYLSAAMICATSFAIQRTETALVAVIFLGLTVMQSRLPRRALTPWLAALVVLIALWFETLARHVAADGDFLTPTRAHLITLALLATFAWWLAIPIRVVARINRWLPGAVLVTVALALVAAFATKGSHMVHSAEQWVLNLTTLPHWGQSWFVIVALGMLMLALRPAPGRAPFVIGIPVYLGVILLLVYGRQAYRAGLGDSANRMTIHVVPLIFWYVGLKVIAALGSASPQGDDGGVDGTRPADSTTSS